LRRRWKHSSEGTKAALAGDPEVPEVADGVAAIAVVTEAAANAAVVIEAACGWSSVEWVVVRPVWAG
jgi:hypothetical protein